MCLEDRPVLEPNAAGVDIGAREIFVAVPPDRDEHPVRACSTFTENLTRMVEWLVAYLQDDSEKRRLSNAGPVWARLDAAQSARVDFHLRGWERGRGHYRTRQPGAH
jgi:hypothetical protein